MDRHTDFHPFDFLFDQEGLPELACVRHRSLQVLGEIDKPQADRRALGIGLDHAREKDSIDIKKFSWGQCDPMRHSDRVGRQDLLGQSFVHRERAGLNTRPGVRQMQQLQ